MSSLPAVVYFENGACAIDHPHVVLTIDADPVWIVDDALAPRPEVVAFGIEHHEGIDLAVAMQHIHIALLVVGDHRYASEVPAGGHRLPRLGIATPKGLYAESQMDLHSQQTRPRADTTRRRPTPAPALSTRVPDGCGSAPGAAPRAPPPRRCCCATRETDATRQIARVQSSSYPLPPTVNLRELARQYHGLPTSGHPAFVLLDFKRTG